MSDESAYELLYSEEALDGFRKIDRDVGERVRKKLAWLAENADETHHALLSGNWSGFYKLRVGDYRVIYDIDTEARHIIIERVRHRRDAYD